MCIPRECSQQRTNWLSINRSSFAAANQVVRWLAWPMNASGWPKMQVKMQDTGWENADSENDRPTVLTRRENGGPTTHERDPFCIVMGYRDFSHFNCPPCDIRHPEIEIFNSRVLQRHFLRHYAKILWRSVTLLQRYRVFAFSTEMQKFTRWSRLIWHNFLSQVKAKIE